MGKLMTSDRDYPTTLELRYNFRTETPMGQFRWLKKKSGEKVLQQAWEIQENFEVRFEWRNIEEVEEE